MQYENLIFKVPHESADYEKCSEEVIESISKIIQASIDNKKNYIQINTNLKLGLPMENINKIAGPLVEAWAHETFHEVFEDVNNEYRLVHVEAKPRLYMADVILQFKREVPNGRLTSITAEVDVKATSEDIEDSGKSPNITSYARIRTAYVDDPDYIFVILSLKHKVVSSRNTETLMMDAIMEIVAHHAYDLKYLSTEDLSYNPALGTGQIQVRDIHYVTTKKRNAWEFCQLLDQKFLNSTRRNFDQWYELARKFGWIKNE